MADVPAIQTGDGSQAATAASFRVGSFGPSPTPHIETNVAAPLDVRGGPGQASYLAAQLQSSLETMRWPLMTAERVAGMQHAKQETEQGTSDALAGTVDDETMKKDSAYRSGATRVIAQRAALKAVSGWQDYAADPKNGLASMSPGQVLNAHDQFMRQQLGGLEQDPDAASAIVGIVQHSAQETLGRFLQFKTQQNFNDGVTNAAQLAQAQADHGGTAFQYQDQLSTLTALAHGNRAFAKQELDKALIQQATAGHNPALLDMIQAAPGQKGPAPSTALAISEARDGINRYNADQNSQAVQQRQYGILSQWDDSLSAKTPIPQTAITEAVNNHDISQEAGLAYIQKSNELRDRLTANAGAGASMASGPWYTQVGTQIPGAKPGRLYTKQDFQNSADESIYRLPPQQRIGAAVRLTQTQGLTYTPLQSTLNNEPLNTAQGVKDVLGSYQGMNSIDPTVTSKYFSDPKRLAEVHQLQQLKQAGMSDDDIASYVTKHGFTAQSADAVGAKAADVNKSLSSWKVQNGTLGFGSVSFNDLANPGQVESRVTARAHQLAESGICTPATCVSQAQRQIQNESYVIKLGSGHSLMVPRTQSDPPPAQSQPALQWFYDSQIAGVAKAGGYQGDPSELRLVPNTAQPGTYSLLTATGLPASHDTFTLHGIVGAYTKSRAGEVAAQQQTAAARAVQNTAVNRTKRDLFQTLD